MKNKKLPKRLVQFKPKASKLRDGRVRVKPEQTRQDLKQAFLELGAMDDTLRASIIDSLTTDELEAIAGANSIITMQSIKDIKSDIFKMSRIVAKGKK